MIENETIERFQAKYDRDGVAKVDLELSYSKNFSCSNLNSKHQSIDTDILTPYCCISSMSIFNFRTSKFECLNENNESQLKCIEGFLESNIFNLEILNWHTHRN